MSNQLGKTILDHINNIIIDGDEDEHDCDCCHEDTEEDIEVIEENGQ